MATVESLIVELDAKIDGYVDEMKKADAKSKDSSLNILKIGKSAATMSAAVLTAATAAAGAIAAVVVQTAKARQEQELLAKQAGVTVDQFNAITFATKQAGITSEQYADISKDLSDKLGEFATVGTGAFQDFADVVGLNKEEAMLLAEEWQNLSSDQVIGAMVSEMEKAGATTAQTTFVLESMGNDLSRLSDLFADNGAGLAEMTKRYDDATEGMKLTAQQAESLEDTAESFDLLTTQAGEAAGAITATLAPVMNGFFNSVIEVVPQATQAIIDFINSFLDAEQIQSISQIDRQIEELNDQMGGLAASAELVKDAWADGTIGRVSDAQIARAEKHEELLQRQNELLAQRAVLEAENQKLEEARQIEGGEIAGGKVLTVEQAKEQADAEVAINQEKNDQIIQAEIDKEEFIRQLRQKEFDAKLKQFEDEQKALEKQAREEEKTKKQKQRQNETIARAGMDLANVLFEDNKAVRIGLVVADTAAAIQRQFADLPYPAALATSAAIAASGAQQIANIQSSSKGGGSVSSDAGDVTVGATTTSAVPETSTLDINAAGVDTTGGGTGGAVRVVFDVDSGDALLDALAGALNEGQRQGR